MHIAVGLSSVPIYFYRFAFEGKLNLSYLMLGSNRLPGKSAATLTSLCLLFCPN
jgi:hypothetical protein